MVGQPPVNRSNYGGGRGGSGGGGYSPGLPVEYLRNGYFDEQGYIHRELLEVKAQEVARKLNEQRLTTNQFRRFYDYARALDRKLNLLGNFKSIEGDVAKIRAFAAAAVGRGNAPDEFKIFIDKNIEITIDDKSFRRGFLEHLQAVLAFHIYFVEKNKRGGRR